MEDEFWKPISGFERYMISSHGRVRGLKGTYIGQITKDGYMGVTLFRHGSRHQRFIHNLMLETFVSPRPFPGAVTRHLDGVRVHNVLSNICWGTQQENADDRATHGTSYAGENNPKAILTEEKVNLIRAALTNPLFTMAEISREFGVSPSTIENINSGKTWNH